MIGCRHFHSLVRVIGDTLSLNQTHQTPNLLNLKSSVAYNQTSGCHDLIQYFTQSFMDTREAFLCGQELADLGTSQRNRIGEIVQAYVVLSIRGRDVFVRWAEEDLGGGRFGTVVEIPQDDGVNVLGRLHLCVEKSSHRCGLGSPEEKGDACRFSP